MIQARQLGSSHGAQAALAVMAAALVMVAGVGGYEIGNSVGRSQVAAAPPAESSAAPQTCDGNAAPPVIGLQP